MLVSTSSFTSDYRMPYFFRSRVREAYRRSGQASCRTQEAARRPRERSRGTFDRQAAQEVADDLRKVRVVIRAVLLASRHRGLIQEQVLGDLGHGVPTRACSGNKHAHDDPRRSRVTIVHP